MVLCELSLNPLRGGGGGVYFRTFWVGMCRWDPETFRLYQTYNHGQKSWDTFAFLGRFPIHASPTPPLTQQTMLHACTFRIFSFQLCIGWGE